MDSVKETAEGIYGAADELRRRNDALLEIAVSKMQALVFMAVDFANEHRKNGWHAFGDEYLGDLETKLTEVALQKGADEEEALAFTREINEVNKARTEFLEKYYLPAKESYLRAVNLARNSYANAAGGSARVARVFGVPGANNMFGTTPADIEKLEETILSFDLIAYYLDSMFPKLRHEADKILKLSSLGDCLTDYDVKFNAVREELSEQLARQHYAKPGERVEKIIIEAGANEYAKVKSGEALKEAQRTYALAGVPQGQLEEFGDEF